MLVEMLKRCIAGGLPREAGEAVELADDEAKRLIAMGKAAPAKPKADKPKAR